MHSLDGTDPLTWDEQMDAVIAAPENHKVLYEDDTIRVISVSVLPGTQEKPHHHRWPSVFVIDRMVNCSIMMALRESRFRCPFPSSSSRR